MAVQAQQQQKLPELTKADTEMFNKLLLKRETEITCAAPEVIFIEDAYRVVKEHGAKIFVFVQNLMQKFKFLESNLVRRKQMRIQKVKDVESDVEALRKLLKARDQQEAMEGTFQLCDQVYAKAKINTKASKCNLWLGANVMVEYTFEEALRLM